ncbi:ATP-binding cassette domain-containing protein [Dinoroseobacter sp. PD6]|uniref:ATP-binding cassette domain-containing protein n=1 Tax=Dinoroseobacter sp. PD6 TaxID=3028384 RepID=UPI00237B6DF7|nr:ATP-binding cassette domain-containing protein [Dinoroseobacter sp. PD6]MDD9718371.1 ATP-binding cassette domain-containing protein [Dinoroseobacter sp. PD6]
MRDFHTHPELELGDKLLEARDIVLMRGGKRLLDGVDLSLPAGRRTVIMGANGAGKSLLLRVLHGLIAPDAGQVLWHGAPLSAEARQAQSMVLQRPVLLRRSVLSNLRFALSVRGIRGKERAAREAEALDRAGLSELARRPARVLSGGEQQRLAVARALSTAPRMLLLDEPTASLDPAATRQIESQINAAHGAGVTVVMVTHDHGQARRMADDILFLHRGRVAEAGPAQQVLTAPRSAAVAAWLDGRFYDGP